MDELPKDETIKYELPVRKLIIKIEDLAERNRERILILENMSASKRIIERFRDMQKELLACLELAVKSPVNAEQEIQKIHDKYCKMLIF